LNSGKRFPHAADAADFGLRTWDIGLSVTDEQRINSQQPCASRQESGLAAVIDIGASAIRMEIAEIGENGELRTLEQLRQGCHLGKDTFTKNRIQQSTIRECVEILRDFSA